MISIEDYHWFVDEMLNQQLAIVRELGDLRCNERLNLPGANSPYAIVVHCLGVMNWWGGALVAGREINRDRDSEFTATGSVSDLVELIEVGRRQFRLDVATADLPAEIRIIPHPAYLEFIPPGKTQGNALFKIFEELAQHLGHLELTRDVMNASG